MSQPTLQLNFFDCHITLESELDCLRQNVAYFYRRFVVTELPVPPPAEIIRIAVGVGSNGSGPFLSWQGQEWPVPHPALLPYYVQSCIFNTLTTRVQSHLLIHAGVVARHGQGLMLVADSGHGKTTLTLQLVRRGFQFLSDETAALSLADRTIHPFPRALGLRAGTLALPALADLSFQTPAYLGRKPLVDIDQLAPASLGQAVPLRYVIFLRSPAPDQAGPERPTVSLRLTLDRINETFVTTVRRLPYVTVAEAETVNGFGQLYLELARQQQPALFTHIDTLCRQHRLWLFNVARTLERPIFTRPLSLTPIPSSQAVLALLHHFQGGYQSSLLQQQRRSAAWLYTQLAAFVSTAQCYQLTVGPLADMTHRVEQLFNE